MMRNSSDRKGYTVFEIVKRMVESTTFHKGFTLIELLLVIAIIGLIATIVLVGQNSTQAKRRDVKRVADVASLQKALALYTAKMQTYPVFTGCVDGTGSDTVTSGLVSNGFIGASANMIDPMYASDTTKCYYYTAATGGQYTLRYTLEATSASGAVGNHTVVP